MATKVVVSQPQSINVRINQPSQEIVHTNTTFVGQLEVIEEINVIYNEANSAYELANTAYNIAIDDIDGGTY